MQSCEESQSSSSKILGKEHTTLVVKIASVQGFPLLQHDYFMGVVHLTLIGFVSNVTEFIPDFYVSPFTQQICVAT